MAHLSRLGRLSLLIGVLLVTGFNGLVRGAEPVYRSEFASLKLGTVPQGFIDLRNDCINPPFVIDGKSCLRVMAKSYNALLGYAGARVGDGSIEAEFRKTPEPEVFIGLIGRAQDARNYYEFRLSGTDRLALLKVTDGKAEELGQFVTLNHCLPGQVWRIGLTLSGKQITGRVWNEKGVEQARLDALDGDFKAGMVGLSATTYVAVPGVRIFAEQAKGPATQSAQPMEYPVVKPEFGVDSINTPFDRLAGEYDVIVAGGGTGGWAAAVQASRLGSRVLLLEESDWLGGQMAAAAVATMDEEGIWFQFPVRERGIYREFLEGMTNYYQTLDKDPFRAYYSWPEQTEGGYEPKAARAMLYGLIAEARARKGADGRPSVLDVSTQSRVVKVRKEGEAITGATIETWVKDAKQTKEIACRVLVEATEYGDVIPLTGARYRVGNTISDALKMDAPLQDHTWVGVIREYPEGIPDHLRMKQPPPDYEIYGKKMPRHKLWGMVMWGGPARGIKADRSYRVLLAWRGMADADSPMTGKATERRHTQCGLNGGNQDYPVKVANIEDPATRRAGERGGIYRTLAVVYYLQHELGLNWALAEDEGYNTRYNQRQMKELGLREDALAQAVYLPQWPYVREGRRAIGMYTQRASDMGRFENEKLFPTSVAMGDYFMDLHRTDEAIETDLDTNEYAKGGGPFQVPFEVFVPEKVDGMVLAEKNLSQSRLVNGATRLQPITMLTGQAAGAIAGMAVKEKVQPRKLNPIHAQAALLREGSTLIQRWYVDVPWRSEIWQATQLLSLYQVMDRPAPIHKREGPLREKWTWGVNEPLSKEDLARATNRLAELLGKAPAVAGAERMTRGQFALEAARLLVAEGSPR